MVSATFPSIFPQKLKYPAEHFFKDTKLFKQMDQNLFSLLSKPFFYESLADFKKKRSLEISSKNPYLKSYHLL